MHQFFILGAIGINFVAGDEGNQRTMVTGCDRGGDQANEDITKYLVTPDFPSYHREILSCKWT